jgi:hypothetical protein
MVVVGRQADLMQVVTALAAPGRFAGCLHGGKQKGNQDSDDGDDNQQFNQRETGATAVALRKRKAST